MQGGRIDLCLLQVAPAVRGLGWGSCCKARAGIRSHRAATVTCVRVWHYLCACTRPLLCPTQVHHAGLVDAGSAEGGAAWVPTRVRG